MTRRVAACCVVFAVVFGIAPMARGDHSKAHVKEQIRVAWGGNDKKAIRVAKCESGLDPDATSPTGKYLGLWQFSKATWKDYDGPGNDPRKVNARRQTEVAYRLYQDRGWSPWPSCGSA